MAKKSHLKIIVSCRGIRVIFLGKEKSFGVPLKTFDFFSVQQTLFGPLCVPGTVLGTENFKNETGPLAGKLTLNCSVWVFSFTL